MGMMNRVYREDLGKAIGEVMELDIDKDSIGWGPYLRIKFWFNISKPLIRCKLINFVGNQSWIF